MEESLIRHYLPQWLLHNFRGERLYELDIFTGEINERKVRKAGSDVGLWQDDIEDDLSEHDNEAARIWRYKIWNHRRIELNDKEKLAFARWLAHFMIRVPNTRLDFVKHLEKEKENPQVALKLLMDERKRVLGILREGDPEFYDEFIAEIGPDAEDELLRDMAERVMAKSEKWLGNEADLHQFYLRNNSSEKFARHLYQKFDWIWLRTQESFVIGDNPLVRWDTGRNQWNYGINRENVEITFPVSSQLCLCLRKRFKIDCKEMLHCNAADTRAYNCRQRLASSKHVYSNSRDQLFF